MAIVADTVTITVPRRMPAVAWAAFRIVSAIDRGKQPRVVDIMTLLRYVARLGE